MVQKLFKLFLVLCILGFSNIQAQTVSGSITDAADGTPLPGVNVILQGTNTGVSSDFDGNYTIDITVDNAVLQFSFLGYTSQNIAVGGQTTINVALVQSAEALSEVVVTALGIKKETQALTNLLTGDIEIKKVDEKGNILFEIENSVDFRFYKYEVK